MSFLFGGKRGPSKIPRTVKVVADALKNEKSAQKSKPGVVPAVAGALKNETSEKEEARTVVRRSLKGGRGFQSLAFESALALSDREKRKNTALGGGRR